MLLSAWFLCLFLAIKIFPSNESALDLFFHFLAPGTSALSIVPKDLLLFLPSLSLTSFFQQNSYSIETSFTFI